VENTATGWYHGRNDERLTRKEDLGKALCSACGPTSYPSGEPIEDMGKWHNRFRRRYYEKGTLYTDQQGNVRDKRTLEPPRPEAELEGPSG
jgi:hypothetical protein